MDRRKKETRIGITSHHFVGLLLYYEFIKYVLSYHQNKYISVTFWIYQNERAILYSEQLGEYTLKCQINF